MNITEEYVEKCEKSIEIQKMWKTPQAGDYYFDKLKDHVGVLCEKCIIKKDIKSFIWLPKFDQIVHMTLPLLLPYQTVESNGVNKTMEWLHLAFFSHFRDYYEKSLYKNGLYEGVDEIALQFYMYQKFNKEWDNTKKEWISSKKG